MRLLVLAIMCGVLALPCGQANAQADQPKNDQPKSDSLNATTGRTPPEPKGQLQPQGWTGPLDTTSGGAPPESPQGQSPPGMQPAPEGSTKTVVKPE